MNENNPQTTNESNKSARSWLPIMVIVLVAAVVGVYATIINNTNKKEAAQEAERATKQEKLESDSKTSPVGNITAPPAQVVTPPVNAPPPNEGASTGTQQTKTFTVDGNNFSFSLKEIRVKKGDKVKIVFNNKVGFHDWVLDEFNAKTPQLAEGKSAEVEFTADKTGTFEYYCSVGQHRKMGMVGQLIVE